MSLRKYMDLNERVFHQNINSRPLIVTYKLSINLYIILYLGICGLFQKLWVHSKLIENIQLWMLQKCYSTGVISIINTSFPICISICLQ